MFAPLRLRGSSRAFFVTAAIAGALALASCAQTQTQASDQSVTETPVPAPPAPMHPEIWPTAHSGVARDPAIEARAAQILAQMTVEEKVGQIMQADVNSVTPDDVRRYHLGSVLNGGNSGPGGDDRAAPAVWLDYADRFYDASMQAFGDRIAIPVIWGSDSVHGNANLIGATVFPHNIGLGAMRDPALMEQIGQVTAVETRVTGQDWTFAPTIAVVRDDRWGRTYEAYSEEPTIVASYAPAIVRGIQGNPGAPDFLRGPHIIATAKHFLGDGGTNGGRDQGDNIYSEEELRDLFAPGYPAAVEAGVQSVMASYNSWHGIKSHGNGQLLSDILVGRFGFDGFVVGDWNGHGQVPGCTTTNCINSLLAGLDMYMAPDSWRELYETTLARVQSGEVPMARLDEAVLRILRVKLRSGVFEAGRPSSRPFAGQWNQLGSPEHRAVARQAVRESLVLLKNEDSILPLRRNLNVLVAGDGANDLGKQAGGWTISWQGTGNSREDFPNGQTIYEGIREAVTGAGGSARLSVDGYDRYAGNTRFSVDGSFTGRKPDVAIVVFGENPYAEFQGDRPNVDYQGGERTDLELIERLRAQGIPVVSVFLSGRPLYVTPEINASNAFVAAWLPGSEGAGVADVLFRDRRGAVQYDFHGKLSFSWPRAPDQTPLNVGDADYNPLFAWGYGMTYATPQNLGVLPLAAPSTGANANVSLDRYFGSGRASAGWRLMLQGNPTAMPADVTTPNASTEGGALTLSRFDRRAQEDSIRAAWNGTGYGALIIGGSDIDLTRQANGELRLTFEVNVESAPTGRVGLGMASTCAGGYCSGVLDITDQLQAGQGWVEVSMPLSCFAGAGASLDHVVAPYVLATSGRMTLGVSGVRLTPAVGAATACPAKLQ